MWTVDHRERRLISNKHREEWIITIPWAGREARIAKTGIVSTLVWHGVIVLQTVKLQIPELIGWARVYFSRLWRERRGAPWIGCQRIARRKSTNNYSLAHIQTNLRFTVFVFIPLSCEHSQVFVKVGNVVFPSPDVQVYFSCYNWFMKQMWSITKLVATTGSANMVS